LESVRRAVKTLADEGLIRLQYDDPHRSGARRGAFGRVGQDYVLMARLDHGVDERGERSAS
jgi:hypothetical protein